MCMYMCDTCTCACISAQMSNHQADQPGRRQRESTQIRTRWLVGLTRRCGLRPRMLGEGGEPDGQTGKKGRPSSLRAFVNEGPFPDTSEMLSTLRFASHEYVAVLLRSRRLAPGFFGAVRGPIGSVYARSTGAHQSRTTRGPCRALCVRRRDRLSNLLPLAPFSSPAGRMHTTNQRAPRRAVSQLRR